MVRFACIKIAADSIRPMAQAMVNRVAAGKWFDLLDQERAKNGEKAHSNIIKDGDWL
jgi:hypothetical protein